MSLKGTKVFVGIDNYDDFRIIELVEKEKVIAFIKEMHGGDYWANGKQEIFEDLGICSTLSLYNDDELYEEFVSYFCQRGICNIVTL